MAMSCLKWQFADLSSQRPRFDPRAVNVRFVVDRVFFPNTSFPFAGIILPLLHAPTLFTYHQNHIALDTDSSCYQLPVRVLV
jgi:hypothetical protein